MSPIPAPASDDNREVRFLADQLERGFYGGAWHGLALQEVLDGIDAATARHRIDPNVKTPWEIVHHLTTWHGIAARRIRGEAPVVTPYEDWPPRPNPTNTADPADTSEAAWQAAVQTLEARHRELYRTVRGLDDARLDDAVAGSDPTVRGLLLGTLQHNSYHAGQIALLKKAGK